MKSRDRRSVCMVNRGAATGGIAFHDRVLERTYGLAILAIMRV